MIKCRKCGRVKLAHPEPLWTTVEDGAFMCQVYVLGLHPSLADIDEPHFRMPLLMQGERGIEAWARVRGSAVDRAKAGAQMVLCRSCDIAYATGTAHQGGMANV